MAFYAPAEAITAKIVGELREAFVAVRAQETAAEIEKTRIQEAGQTERAKIQADAEARRMSVAGWTATGFAGVLAAIVVVAMFRADKVELSAVAALLTTAGLAPLVALLVSKVIERRSVRRSDLVRADGGYPWGSAGGPL